MFRQNIHYFKPQQIDIMKLHTQYSDSDSDQNYNPFDLEKMQLYNPIYKRFFDMNKTNYDKIALNNCYHIQDLEHVTCMNTNEILDRPIFIKYSPLLDPYRYMIGKYNIESNHIRTMPQLNSTSAEVHPKILSQNNASYVDAFFSYLSSKLLHDYGFVNGVDFYGSYLGIQKNFKVSVMDDLEYLKASTFFNTHVGELFYLEENADLFDDDISLLNESRKKRQRLCIEDNSEIILNDIQEIPSSIFQFNTLPDEDTELSTIYSRTHRSSGSLYSTDSDDSEINYSSSDDSETYNSGSIESDSMESESGDSDETSSYETIEEDVYGYIHNFPIQLICMEKCEGTLDQLFENDEINEENGCSALFQIIMTILTYQKAFQFTHNDLHTNNVMYIKTDKEYIFYKFEGKTYKVPTYGKIYKIIDFGRSIYKYLDKTFCSDSFAPGGDASTQYNCEPFLNENKPRLIPNNAFDLCRLGTSIFDFMMDIDDNYDELDDLQKIIYDWCKDDNGKNVLYRKNGNERYPSFKLYKMIARTVHKHIPEEQLEHPFFAKYLHHDSTENETVFSIDDLM